MRWNAVIGGVLLAASGVTEAPQAYGCWSIRDQIERLACFDEAIGPPGPGVKEARPAPDAEKIVPHQATTTPER